MSPAVTRANSRHVAVPYFLRSRVPLGNASNLIGVHGGAEAPKRQKARVKKDNTRAKGAAARGHDLTSVCDPVKQPVTHTHTEVFSSLLLNIIPDVDSADALDAQMCSEYVRDIYAYLQQLEVTMAIKPHYLEGQEVSGSMRAVAIDWLMQVQREFKLRQETFFMSVGIIDRFLQNNPVPKKYFQLVCVTAMLIAAKYEEIYPPTVGDFVFVTDGAYTCGDVRRMERIVLKRLNYSLGRPGPVHFLQRACKVGQASARAGELAMFLLELTALDYELIHVPPSLVAAAALAASLRILGSGDWSPSLQYYTGYGEDALAPVVQAVARTLQTLPEESKLHEMKRKYVTMSPRACENDGSFSERVQKLLC